MNSIEATTEVEKYLDSKGLPYRVNGDEAILESCPFCKKGNWKFFINTGTWQYICFHGSCKVKGNKFKLLPQFGDSASWELDLRESKSYRVGSRYKREPDIPSPSTIEAWTDVIDDSEDLQAFFKESRGWSYDAITKMKIGVTSEWFRDAGTLYCTAYPYHENGQCVFVKYKPLPQEWQPEGVTIPEGFKGVKSSGGEARLYNVDAISQGMDYLFIVEGEPDTVSMINASEENVVGIPGAGLHKSEWEPLLKMPKKRYLLFDNDKPGQDGARAFAAAYPDLEFHNVVLPAFKIEPGNAGKDITDWMRAFPQPVFVIEDLLENDARVEQLNKRNRFAATLRTPGFILENTPKPDWLVEQFLLEGGTTLLSGLPKGGKSTLSKQLAVSVANGFESMLGRSVKQGKVVYFQIDDSPRRTAETIGFMGHNLQSETLLVSDRRFDRANALRVLQDTLAEHPDTRLMILDTLAKIVPIDDFNSYAETVNRLAPLAEFAEESGVCLLMLHHSTKAGGNSGNAINSASGSAGLTGAVDIAMTIQALSDPVNAGQIDSRAREGGDLQKLIVQWNKDTHLYELPDGDTTIQTRADDSRERALIAFLELQGGSATRGEIAATKMVTGEKQARSATIASLMRTGTVQEISATVNGSRAKRIILVGFRDDDTNPTPVTGFGPILVTP
jgi:hypothetical protein